MLARIFPKQIDDTYRGYRLAIWLLVPIVLVKMIMSTNIFINTQDVIKGPDGIPLEAFGVVPAAIIVQCFRSWALNHFVFAALGLVAVLRYRAMVPLMYLALAADGAGRVALFLAAPLPIRHAGGPSLGLMINVALAAALLIGFALSLGKPERPATANDVAN